MQYLVILALALGVANAASISQKDQPYRTALDKLRGKDALDAGALAALDAAAQPDTDFPVNAVIPAAGITCGGDQKPGFYANVAEPSKCQAFDRCDINGNLTSYLCPNKTLFNQITLICDHFYNVDCSKSADYSDYTNSRLYVEGAKLLDDQPDDVVSAGSSAASGDAVVKKNNAQLKKGGKKAAAAKPQGRAGPAATTPAPAASDAAEAAAPETTPAGDAAASEAPATDASAAARRR